jgi:hypothetical protein
MTTYSILTKPLVANTSARDLTRTEVKRLQAQGVPAKTTWSVTSDGQVWDRNSYSVSSVRVCMA